MPGVVVGRRVGAGLRVELAHRQRRVVVELDIVRVEAELQQRSLELDLEGDVLAPPGHACHPRFFGVRIGDMPSMRARAASRARASTSFTTL